MSAILTVFRKEFLENLRDRRTVMTALLLGPLFGPILFSVMLQFSLDRTRLDADQGVMLAVLHPERAPNLIAFLESRGVRIEALVGDEPEARQAVASHTARAVLEIPESFGAELVAARPAVVRIYMDRSRSADGRHGQRVQLLLGQYSQQLASQRLLLRGIDPLVVAPIAIQDIDVSTPAARAQLVLGMLSFFIILSLLTGGMYLAIDTTAGERERGTLEPLLATPVSRSSLLLGKLAATCTYMLLSMSITTSALCFALGRIDLERFGMSADLGPGTAIRIIAMAAPLVPMMGAGMTLVAAWARTAREAQAWVGILQLIPTVPLVFASLLNLTASVPLLLVPSLSQHLLISATLRDETPTVMQVALSAGGSLAVGVALVLLASRLYRRERLLA